MENLKVSDLMSPFGWDKEKLESILLPIDRELVWSIPLSSRRRPDRWVWHYDGKEGFLLGLLTELKWIGGARDLRQGED